MWQGVSTGNHKFSTMSGIFMCISIPISLFTERYVFLFIILKGVDRKWQK